MGSCYTDAMKKKVLKSKKNTYRDPEFRPYRVLFLVIVVAVTSLVLLAALGVGTDA